MKKLITVLFIIIITFSVCVPTSAQNVFDMQDFLGDYRYELEQISMQLEEKHKTAPKVIVGDRSSYAYSQIEYYTRYDYNDYVMLSITTCSDGSYLTHSVLCPDEKVSVFDGKFKRKVKKAIMPYLLSGDYSAAAESFFEVFDKHIGKVNRHPVQKWLKKQLYKHYPLLIGFSISFTIALVCAVSFVLTNKRKLKNVQSAEDAFKYIDSEYLEMKISKESVDSIFDLLSL